VMGSQLHRVSRPDSIVAGRLSFRVAQELMGERCWKYCVTSL
jgi:hypothetical protein